MRMPQVRITIRRMMAVVAACGLSSWLISTALRVQADPESRMIYHWWETNEPLLGPHKDKAFNQGTGHLAPFWPRYWRRALGQPWPGTFECGEEKCAGTSDWTLPGTTTTFAASVYPRQKLGIGSRNPLLDRARAEIDKARRRIHPPKE